MWKKEKRKREIKKLAFKLAALSSKPWTSSDHPGSGLSQWNGISQYTMVILAPVSLHEL